MSAERQPAFDSLPAAASVALLTLQLRAALRDAEEAEASEAAIDLEAARAQMRPRLDALVAERRIALDSDLTEARQAADDLVASARSEAAAMLEEANRRVAELALLAPPPPPMEQPEPESIGPTMFVVPTETMALAEPAVSSETVVVLERAVERAVAESLNPLPESEIDPWAVHGVQSVSAEGSPVVTVDAEAFAKVFATVLATVLDERFAAWRATMLETPTLSATPPQVVSAREPFARRMFHLDIVLMALAAAIIVVLLFAWLG